MSFKHAVFLIVFLLSLTHCGLKIGEEAINPLVYRVKEGGSLCDVLDYKKELKDYMNEYYYDVSNQRVNYVLNCLAFKVSQYQESVIGHNREYFTDEEITKLLKVVSGNDGIINPRSLSKAIAIKDLVVRAIHLYKESPIRHNRSVSSSQCLSQEKRIVSRQDIRIFVESLKDFSEVLLFINVRSEDLFRKIHNIDPDAFSSAKQEKFFRIFNLVVRNKVWNSGFYSFNQMSEVDLDSTLLILKSMILDYSKYDKGKELKKAHLKYMLINMYLVEMIFNLYDKNKNLILEGEELDEAFCLFGPIIDFFIDLALKDKYILKNVLKPIFEEKNIFEYTLKNKKIPKGLNLEIVKMKYNDLFGAPKDSNLSLNYIELTEIFRNLSRPLIVK